METTTLRVMGIAAIILVTNQLLPMAEAVTLDECIAAALKNSPDVRAATERVQAARSAIREAQSAYYPIVTASTAYVRTDNPPQAFMMLLNQRSASLQADFNNPADTDNLALSLGLKYRLFDFGRSSLDANMARNGEEVATFFLKSLQNELIHQVTRGHYSILQASEFVSVQEESIQTIQENLRVASERLKAGDAVKTDVLNLEVHLAQAKEDLIRARNGIKLALAALNTAVGTNIVAATNMPKAGSLEIRKPEAIDEAEAIRNRPELEAARWLANIQQMKADKAWREHLPTVSLFGSSDWNSPSSSSFEQSYMVGIMAEMDLFDGFRRSAAVDGSQAQARAAAAETDKASNNIKLDITSATVQADDAFERLDVARKSIENAEEALRITKERYQQGATGISELLTAQIGLTGTRSRNVAARYDYLIASSNLERAKGKLVTTYVK